MFGFLKKKKTEDVPPDIGKEVLPEEVPEENISEEEEEPLNEPVIKTKKGKKPSKSEEKSLKSEAREFELQKISARIESINEIIKGYSERFASLSERLGEIRTMAVNNEKTIARSTQDSERAVDIVREVKPEKMRMDYQKLDLRIQAIEEKIVSNMQFVESVMNEVKDIRKKLGIFVGTEALFRLNDEIKKDLIDTQKLASSARMHADKSEEVFLEIKRIIAENQKISGIVKNLDLSYAGVQKEVQGLKLDHSNIVTLDEFQKFKNYFESKISEITKSMQQINGMEEREKKVEELSEKTLAIVKNNVEDIENMAATIGDNRVQRIGDFETKLSSTLNIIENLATQINQLKEKMGMKKSGQEHIEKMKKEIKTGIKKPKKIKLKSKIPELKKKIKVKKHNKKAEKKVHVNNKISGKKDLKK